MSSGYLVVPPNGREGTLSSAQFSNPTTTRQKVSFPSGAVWLLLSYQLLPGATAVAGQYLKVVLNAASDADANGKLATSGAYVVVHQGDSFALSAPASDPIRRVDFQTAQAVGAEVTLFQVIGGVR